MSVNKNIIDDNIIQVHLVMEENKSNSNKSKTNFSLLTENLTKFIAPLITIGGLLIGVWEFNQQQMINDKMEFKRKIWEKRIDAYTEITGVVSEIVTEKNNHKLDSLSRRYEQLYWGKLPLFDDTLIEQSLKQFQNILHDANSGIKDKNNINENLLKKSGYQLVKNCQRSMILSWNELSK